MYTEFTTKSPPSCLKHWNLLPSLPACEPSPCSSKSSTTISWKADSDTLKTKHEARFNIEDSVAYLKLDCYCSKCENKDGSYAFVVWDSYIITDTSFTMQKVTHRVYTMCMIINTALRFMAENVLYAKRISNMILINHV